ncbi:trace amine-associated receptor 8c-like, partial [Bolinopsis microptera]|uniref:trace amine-associated receptor 8c-like n=1 Tax=Bolinopsis microptera TaxID=2820187 RepID=UPI0030790BD6
YLIPGVFYGVSSLFAIFGNLLVVIVTVRVTQLHSTSNILIGLLCLVDLLYAVCHGVWVSVASLLLYWPWPGGGDGAFCKTSSYASVLWTGILFMLLAAISIDKLVAIAYPLKYRKLMNRRMVGVMFSVSVLTPILLITTPLGILDMQGNLAHKFYTAYGQCTLFFKMADTDSDHEFVEVHEFPIILVPYILWSLTQIVPLVTIIACYSRIFYEVRQQVRNTRRHSIQGRGVLRSYKAVTTIFLIIVTFVVTWIPEFLVDIFIMLHIIEPKDESPLTFAITVVTRWLYYLSPTLDPFIYALRHKRLQSAIKQTFCIPKYRGEYYYSNSDVVSRALRRFSTAVHQSVNSERIQRHSTRILDNVSGSVTSLGSLLSTHIQSHVDIIIETASTATPKFLRRRPASAPIELDHPLSLIQSRPRSWMNARKTSRKVSVVQEMDSPTRSERSRPNTQDPVRREYNFNQISDHIEAESDSCSKISISVESNSSDTQFLGRLFGNGEDEDDGVTMNIISKQTIEKVESVKVDSITSSDELRDNAE